MKLVAGGLLLTAGGLVASAMENGPVDFHQQKALPGFSSCILTMDDGNRLSEWIGFHYHVLKLRNLIVLVDPRSEVSPRPILDRWNDRMKIEEWSDEDVFSAEQLADRSEANLTKLHRARQRAFNVKCMKQLRDWGATWTVMTDTDEYTYINPRTRNSNDPLYIHDFQTSSPDHEGSVLELLESVEQLNLPMDELHLDTACLPLPRLQFGGIESTTEEIENLFPTSITDGSLRAEGFDTFRWRHWGTDVVTSRNGVIPGKTLIDLSKIQDDEVALFSGDPHRPIDRICDPKKVWIDESESLFVSNHVLGSIEKYAYRNDARFTFRVMSYEDRKNVGGHVSDEARLWLNGFVHSVGIEETLRLLDGVGDEKVRKPESSNSMVGDSRCSINFFGLPRSFKTMVLPSVIENVLMPNAKYNCDIFAHYYDLNNEGAGRFNRGGAINASEVESIKSAMEVVAVHAGMQTPTVRFVSETKNDFDIKYGVKVEHYQTDRNSDGELKYFPWADKSYTSVKQLENIVMQWNSIQSVWNLMEDAAEELNKKYDRVAFLRSDVHFATPIDIFQVDNYTPDFDNRFAIVPGFAKHPVNDRMIYGPFDAVKVWATQRFSLLEEHVRSYDLQGYGMHSERLMNHTILPTIVKATGIPVVDNVDICFYRVRPGDSLIISDCNDRDGGSTRGIKEVDEKARVESMVNRLCEVHGIPGVRFQELRCDANTTIEEKRRRTQSFFTQDNSFETPVPSTLPPTPSPTRVPENPDEVDNLPSLPPTSSPTKAPKKSPNDDFEDPDEVDTLPTLSPTPSSTKSPKKNGKNPGKKTEIDPVPTSPRLSPEPTPGPSPATIPGLDFSPGAPSSYDSTGSSSSSSSSKKKKKKKKKYSHKSKKGKHKKLRASGLYRTSTRDLEATLEEDRIDRSKPKKHLRYFRQPRG